MIRKLQRRMTVLVCAVLVMVTAGIVFFINYMNRMNISAQAKSTLAILAENSGERVPEPDTDVPEPDAAGTDLPEGDRGRGQGRTGRKSTPEEKGQPPRLGNGNALAALGNYYVVTVGDDGAVESWTSDRSYLYSDEQVADMTALVLESGKSEGHIGTQFYSLTSREGKQLLIVLDERLELLAAGRVLRASALIAAIACLLLCIGAAILIRALIRPVQDAFDRQRQFVSDASHELKTPLAVISANAQALEGEIGENESLTAITDEVRRTGRMIQNLLTLARMDRAGTSVPLEETDLGDAVLGAILPLESAAFDAGKTIGTCIDEHVLCRGNGDMLRQLTVILLNNAIKYADPGSEITVSVTGKGRSAFLAVENIGEEISQADRERIFDRFYRAEPSHSRTVEGHGLGLAIAKNIADLHGGKITVSSRPAEGGRYRNTFVVRLPKILYNEKRTDNTK